MVLDCLQACYGLDLPQCMEVPHHLCPLVCRSLVIIPLVMLINFCCQIEQNLTGMRPPSWCDIEGFA